MMPPEVLSDHEWSRVFLGRTRLCLQELELEIKIEC